jgi:hypothetical protein
MAKAKRNTFIDMDLKWLEQKAKELKEYCDSPPISQLQDRIVSGKTMATIEEQVTSRRNTLKDYLQIVEAIDKLKEIENSKKVATRGDAELSPLEMGTL